MRDERERSVSRTRSSTFQIRGFVAGIVVALIAAYAVPWLPHPSGPLTVLIILFAVVGVLGAIAGQLVFMVLDARGWFDGQGTSGDAAWRDDAPQ